MLLNLGTNFNLPKDKLDDLANRIEESITGQESLFAYPKEIEAMARTYARKTLRRKAVVLKQEDRSSNYLPDYQVVDVNSVEIP